MGIKRFRSQKSTPTLHPSKTDQVTALLLPQNQKYLLLELPPLAALADVGVETYGATQSASFCSRCYSFYEANLNPRVLL